MQLVKVMPSDDLCCSGVEPSVLFKGQGLVKAQQRFPCFVWVEMCWALQAGMLIAPTENACLETLISSIHSTCDYIFLPSLLSPTVLMYNGSIIVQTTHARMCYALPSRLKITFRG
jgi:hypothetical protein